jgi:hypothetical protein
VRTSSSQCGGTSSLPHRTRSSWTTGKSRILLPVGSPRPAPGQREIRWNWSFSLLKGSSLIRTTNSKYLSWRHSVLSSLGDAERAAGPSCPYHGHGSRVRDHVLDCANWTHHGARVEKVRYAALGLWMCGS